MSEMTKPLLEMQNVSKDYNGNPVLKDVNFTLKAGEVLGLVGENGAGKSTLMNILFGMDVIHQTGGYGGKVLIDGKEVKFTSPLDALKAGIGMVHQEFSLLPGFTAAENIVLNREPENKSVLSLVFGKRANTIDRKALQKKAIEAITKLGVKLDPDMLVSEMPVGHKQFTEISREISKSSIRLLVLDEPTAVLSEKEAEMLLKAIKNLSAQGISVIFITHRLQEIIDVCNKVIVMRDGKIISELDAKKTSIAEMARLMVGREVGGTQVRTEEARPLSDKIVLSIKNLWVDMPGEIVKNVNLDVHQGEFLGIGGLAGQGKIGIPNGIMGLYPAGGHIELNGKPIELNNPRACLDSSLAFVSEDRRGVGLLLDESLEWNVAFTAMQIQNKFLKQYLGGLIKWRDQAAIEEITNKYIKQLQIKCTSSKQKAKELSGGNQQKICLAKSFALQPKLLFVSEPTRGIDIGAKALVLQALKEYNRQNGVTIVMISSELPEVLGMSDRIYIMNEGKMVGELSGEEATQELIMSRILKSSKGE